VSDSVSAPSQQVQPELDDSADFSKKSVVQLKEIATTHGLRTTGKKQDLVQRISRALFPSPDELSQQQKLLADVDQFKDQAPCVPSGLFYAKDLFQKSSCVWPQCGVVKRNFQKTNAEHSHIEHIPQINKNLFRFPHSIHHALHLILALQEHKHKNHMAHKQKHAESNTNQTKITNKTLLDIILFSLMRRFFWCLLRLFSFSIS
jgi:hypothetical protein